MQVNSKRDDTGEEKEREGVS